MPAGASQKREREYKGLERRFRKEHRYPGREDEVAARIVNKQRRELGETAAARQKGRQPELPIEDYERKTVAQLAPQLRQLSRPQLKKLQAWEARHKNRKGVMERLGRMLGG